ncbi:MAG: hypothetical protein RL732_1316 [Bacteroidota bacterium]
MKKLILLFLLAPFISRSQQTFDDPNAEKRQLKGSFHAIHISNAFDCYLSQGNEEAVAVSAASDDIREYIRTTVENGILTVKFLEPEKFWKYTGAKKLKVYISFKQLDELVVSGACDVFFKETLRAKELLIKLSGSSDLRAAIEAEKLNFQLSGASDVAITSGSADDLIIDANGASDFNAFALKVNTCTAEVSGASTVHVTVNKELNVKASGASSVQFKGEGRINQLKTTGASKVNRLEK